jgi:GLPGLI family protein
MIRNLFTTLLLGLSILAGAQTFEGKIVYLIEAPSNLDPQMKMMLPSKSTGFFKNSQARMETQAGMGINTVTLVNGETEETVVLMNIMGNKYAMRNSGKVAKDSLATFDFSTSDSTKVIAGYVCKKASIRFKAEAAGETTQMDVWYTSDLKVNNKHVAGPMAKIEGAILEYSINQQNIRLRFQASEVVQMTLDDSLFVVPEGYKFTTQEELMKSFGR